MRELRKKIVTSLFGLLQLGAVACLGLAAHSVSAQPANDAFTNAFVISGTTGATNGSNVSATLDGCELPFIAYDDFADLDNSVWFAWTAPVSGTVQFDTIGSDFDTVLAVYTTPTDDCDPSASQIAGNDDIASGTQTNSQISFAATAGTTYYISVNGNLDTGFDSGNYNLNWTMSGIPTLAAGAFRLTSQNYVISERDSTGPNSPTVSGVSGARITVTRIGGSTGRATVDYTVDALIYTNIFTTNYYGTNYYSQFVGTNGTFITNSTFTTIISSNAFGYYSGGYNFFSVTNAATNSLLVITNNGFPLPPQSSTGTITWPTNQPPLNNTTNIINISATNIVTDGLTFTNTFITNLFRLPTVYVTQVVTSASGISTNSVRTLTFDDYQMSQDIIVPVTQSAGPDAPAVVGIPSLATVTISNPQLDPLESSDLLPPTIDTNNATALISALSSTFPPGPTVLNFERSTFRVDKDVPGGNAVVSVLRSGGNPCDTITVSYRIDFGPGANQYHTFNLQAGSDYAKPDNQTNPDFTSVTGTLTWGTGDMTPKSISIPILNNGLVEFNADMQLQLFNPTVNACVSPGPGVTLGMVNTATLTILFDDQTCGQQPAGAVDRCWNKDNASDSNPPFLQYPGTSGGVSDSANGNGGTVYAIAEQPDGKAIIAGSFISFDSHPYNRIARLLSNGYQDTTFMVAPNSGANDFIAALALQPDGKIIIAGNFTAFNGNNRHHIARLNTDGTLDSTFNPGLGANGMIWSVALQTNGQMVIGGSFTTYNTNTINSVARLNADGSLDTSFSPGEGPDGTVNSVAVDSIGRVLIGGDFDSVAGTLRGGVARLNVDGSIDTTFDPGIGTYNPDTGSTDPIYAVKLQANGQILIGGAFSYLDLNSVNSLARLNTDGTVDTGFSTGTGTYNPATGVADVIYTVTLQDDGTILIGGDFQIFNQTRRVGVARLLSNGVVDTTFMDMAYNQFAGLINHYHNPNAINNVLYPQGNQRNYVYAIAVEPFTTNVMIGGGFLRVGGGTTRDDVHPRSNIARLIGGATPGPGSIEFSYDNYTVDKNAGALFVSLFRTNGNLGRIQATFNTNTAPAGAGIATPDADFSLDANYRTPTWNSAWSANAWMVSFGIFGPNYNSTPVTDGAAYVYVNVLNNTNITGNLSANFQLSNPNGTDIFFLGGQNIPLGAALGAQSSAPLTIIDDNIRPGALGFSSPIYTVVENQTNAVITVIRTNGADGIVTVQYSTANGTATNNVDYKSVSGTLTFRSGDTNKSFTIPLINGTTVKPDKTVLLNLYNVTGGGTLGLTNATLTIVNDNYTPGHLSFSSPTYAANENAGSANITVNRLGGSSGTMSVTVIANGGTAVNGVNYLASTNVLSWNNADATARTITIPVMDDGIVTPDLTVNLRLTNSTVNSLSTPTPLTFGGTNATLTIVNIDSAGTVHFSSSSYSVKKYGGYALIPVVRTGGSVGTLTVNFGTANGTAQSGFNYTATNGLLTFTNGEVGKFFRVPVIDDGTVDGLLSLNLYLSNAVPAGALSAPSNSVLNIIDTTIVNEPPGNSDSTYDAFGFNDTIYTMALQSNNKLVVGGDFTLADGVPRRRIARLNANGTLDTDFSLPSSKYGADASVRALAVQQDGRIMIGGYFTNFNSVAMNRIARVNPDGRLDSLFNPGSGADNPIYALAETFVGGASKMMVGGSFATLAGTAVNGIARLNYDGTFDTAFDVGLGANGTVYAIAVQSTDGKVLIGGDFTTINGYTNFNHIARLNTDGSVDTTFKVGAGVDNSVRAIAIQSDGRILIGGMFTNVNGTAWNRIARLNADGSVDASFTPGIGANSGVFSIALQSDGRIVVAGQFSRCNGVTRNNITRLNPDGTVDSTINFGTGANNFVAALAIQNDSIEGYPAGVSDEKIIIGGGFTQYNSEPHAYIARIFAGSIGGPGAFQFSMPNFTVHEQGTNALITIIRTGGTSGTNSDGSGNVIVPFATSNGSAISNVNYLGVSSNLVFPVGEVIQTVSIPVIDDNAITSNLTVNLALTPALESEYGNQPTAVLTIINDDSSISFSAPTYTVPKNIINGVAIITVQRSGSVSGTSTVTFNTTSGGTASAGLDYTPVGPVTVTFAAGVSNQIVTIPIINNGLPQGNRTVTMQLSAATGSVLYSPSNAVLTIIDTVTAPGQLSFSSTNYTVTEGGGIGYTNATITVVRSFGSAGVVSVNYATSDGTAVAGAKYIPTNGVLSFADGETSKTFAVQVRNTTTAEGPQYLNLALTNATGGATLTVPTNATLTILNTNIGLAFALPTNSFYETTGTVSIDVVRFNNTNGTTTVNYASTNGTAISNINYLAVGGTLTFNPGESVKTIPVTLIHDTNVTGTLAFALNLSNPSSGAQLTAPASTIIQVLDAEAGLSFISSTTSVFKTAGYAILPVISSNPNVGPVSVNYSTGGGTAVAGVDYTATSGTLVFTNGQNINYILVPIVPNSILQSNLTFDVTLSGATAPGVVMPPSTETVTIIETNTPLGLNFYSPIVLNGDWGSSNVDNNTGFSFFGGPTAWFAWTPTNSGEVEFDTIGSVDDVLGITNLITAMAVYSGANASSLDQVAANSQMFPNTQINYSGQNIYNLANSNGLAVAMPVSGAFIQPYAGPSQVRFTATAGKTYYIAVQTSFGFLSETEVGDANSRFLTLKTVYSPPAGLIKLNWAFHPSGVFRFASEDIDETGLAYSNGIPMLLYRVSETEENRRITGLVDVDQENSTFYGTTFQTNGDFSYPFDVPGLLVTVTRLAGSSGRVQVGYTTEDIGVDSGLIGGTNGYLLNGDLPAQANIDYYPINGLLTFDDSEMSKTIFVPIYDDFGLPQQNRDFTIVLTNAVLDEFESTDVQPPRIDQTFNRVLVRILDTDIDPKGPSAISTVVTNVNPITLSNIVTTNLTWTTIATNGVYNFQKAHYRVTRDISDYWKGTPITVYVNRMGTNNAASPTIHWRVNSFYMDKSGADGRNGEFPLQPGSDYATPNPPDSVGIRGLVPDFNFSGYSGTISFPSGNGAYNPQPITFTVYNNGLQQFNEDFIISLYELDSNGNPHPVGMVDQTTVTILYDNNHPPAGALDEYHNSDFSYDMLALHSTVPPQMSHPGTDGEIYGLAIQPDDKSIIVGDFFSYDLTGRNGIARLNTDGSLDDSFDPGSGVNDFINCIVLETNGEAVIGGAFSSYNGSLRNGIALVSTNGTLDTTFNPGQGFDGTVYALAVQTNGQILVGGNFTSYNGSTRHYLARLNMDGSIDPTFDPGTNLNAAVYSVAVQPSGQLVIGGAFTGVSGVFGQDHIARLNYDGSFDPSFDPGSGANAAVFAVATQPDGNIIIGGEFSIVNGQSAKNIARLTANGYTDAEFFIGTGADQPVYNIVVQTNAILSTTNSSVVVQTNFTIYVGGSFTMINGTHRLGFARLNADGSVDTTFLDSAYNQFAGLPRERYSDPFGTVLASGVQSDGNVMIAGSFERVGGGVSDDFNVRPESLDTNDFLVSDMFAFFHVQKTRSALRNRSNVARLIGGATPGPGNIGLLYGNYSINKSQSPMYVSIIRTNGSLGVASANFDVISGLAKSGVDYSYSGAAPLYWTAWETVDPMGRMHSDGFFGTNGAVQDVYGRTWVGTGTAQPSSITVNILSNTNSLNNLNGKFHLGSPIGVDQFLLGGEDIPLGVALGRSLAPFTLIDDHHVSGTFGFASSSFTGAGNSAVISVSRTNGNYGVVYLSYTTTTNGSTAILNSDYTAVSGTMTFQPNDTTHTFNVPILSSNSTSSAEKTVNLKLFGLNPPVNGIASLGISNAVLRIINPNFQGYLGLASNSYGANLSDGSVTITVTRTVGSKGTLTVQFATTNGTAVSGVDFIGTTNTLQWNNGDVSTRSVTIPLINSGSTGSAKQFGVRLSNPALNGVFTAALFATNSVTNAVVSINNDNSYGAFQFSAPTYTVNETGGYATFTVIRTGGTNGSASVHYATANGTAAAGVNYTTTIGTLSFVAGQLAASFTVPILNDGMIDPAPSAFYFTATLSSPSAGASLGSPVTATNYIVDAASFNRPPGSSDSTFNPGAGMDADVFALALQSNGKIIAGGSFTSVDGVPENYVARLNADGSLDRSGFLYGLSGASSSVYAVVNQTDDQIVVAGAFTNFNGTVLNRIARLNGDGTIDSSFNPGAGADNTIFALAETFSAGTRKIYVAGGFGSMNGISRPFVARLNDNGTVDTAFNTGAGPNATVYAVATYPTNSPLAGKVLIGGGFTNINSFAVGRIARLNANGTIDTNFNLTLNAGDVVRAIAIDNDGKVVIGGDFTNVNGTALNHIARLNADGSLDANFAANVGFGANASVTAISIQPDGRIVVAGQFTLANGVTRNRITRLLPTGAVDPTINFGDGANGAINAVVIQPADQMLVIGGSFTEYNDQPAGHITRIYGGGTTGSGAFTFTAAGYQVDENGVQALIGVRRVGGTSGPNLDGSGSVSVNFATSAGSAVAGVNYSNINTAVSFPPGEVLKYVSVPVMDDFVITSNLTVNLALSNPTPPSGLGDQSTAVLTIVNDDGAVSFGSSTYSVPKNILTGFATVEVLRLGSASGICSVDFLTTTNGSAVPGVDFYPTNLTVNFGDGQSNVIIQIPVINNTNFGNRTVVFTLTNAVNTAIHSPSNTTLTIIDTTIAPGQLSFSATNYTVAANVGSATLTVVRTNGTSGTVSVGYSTAPGTAAPGVNYTPVSGTVTFSDGQTNATFTVPVINNNLAQGPVSLSVLLSNPTGGATLINPTNAALTIVNTNTVITFAAATNTVLETVPTVALNVSRFNNTAGSVSVHYSMQNGTAVSGVNYTASSGTVTFADGQALGAIIVPILHDSQVTGPLVFTVTLSSPSGALIGLPSTNTVIVLDAEAGLSFTNSAMNVARDIGLATITVVTTNPAVEPVIVNSNTVPLSVQFSTSDGTAQAGVDYLAATGTLIFTNGNGTNTFTVPILNNGNVNGDRSFNVRLFNATGPGVIVAPSNQVVTIKDSTSGFRFSSPTYNVYKTSAAATIDVYRAGLTDTVATVVFTATNGSATAGAQYVPTNGVLVFSNGVTTQSFTVPIINTTVVQPDVNVLLQLFSPSNGILISPTAATLTIHDNTGSYVVPAGSTLISETGAGTANGVIDSNETVTLWFAFRDAGGLDVTNLVATLLATNGIISPSSPNSTPTQAYGPLTAGSHSVSRVFTFTAQGTNGQQIAATFQLKDGTTTIGTGVFGYKLGSQTLSFTNASSIIINDKAAASPYPSAININGIAGTVIKATVTLTNLAHTSPADIDVLVVSPSQQDTLLMAHAGAQNAVTNLTLKFDDAATNTLPQSNTITNGVYKPTRYNAVPVFP